LPENETQDEKLFQTNNCVKLVLCENVAGRYACYTSARVSLVIEHVSNICLRQQNKRIAFVATVHDERIRSKEEWKCFWFVSHSLGELRCWSCPVQIVIHV